MKIMKQILTVVLFLVVITSQAQRVPNESENIDYLMTFGKDASGDTGDDDHVQIFFFVIPHNYEEPIYLRVFDPEVGGKHDEIKGTANTKMKYSIYGGTGTFSNEDARQIDPKGEYKSGNLLFSKVFDNRASYDSKWHTFGPINPLEGEASDVVSGRVFKIIAESLTGDDGNGYRYFLSVDPNRNLSVQGANAFAYEYTFKLPARNTISHIYPFIDNSVVSITQSNFDFDKNGEILIYSVAKNRHVGSISGDNTWSSSKHDIVEGEKNTTMDVQILKRDASQNTMSVYIMNQYNQPIPFFAVPIGGPPKYKYDLNLNFKKQKDK